MNHKSYLRIQSLRGVSVVLERSPRVSERLQQGEFPQPSLCSAPLALGQLLGPCASRGSWVLPDMLQSETHDP